MDHSRSHYERRVLVQLLEDGAQETPDRVFSLVPKSQDMKDGFNEITFQGMVQAVDGMCAFLRREFGPRPEHDFETLTYVGSSDIRYAIVVFAAIKCGYKSLLVSIRNTPAVNSSLMEQMASNKLLHSAEMTALASALCSEHTGKKAVQVPSLDEMLSQSGEHVPYELTFEDAIKHPIIVLHSSGSTGSPKPIVLTNGSIATWGADRSYRVPEGRKLAGILALDFGGQGGYMFSPVPIFHVAGVYQKIIVPLYSLAISVWSPALRPPSPELVLEIMQNVNVKALSLTPSLIEGLLHLPEGLERLKGLEWVTFGGGPLSTAAGDEICRFTSLIASYGSTEAGQVRQLVPLPGNWEWIEFHPDECIRMEDTGNGICEIVCTSDPKANANYAGSAAFMHSLPGASEFRTKDLFRRHPSNPNLWQFFGRRDDIIVLSSGEKFNPLPTEGVLTNDSAIQGAQVVGAGQPRPALLVEPHSHSRDDQDFFDKVWNIVQNTNLDAPSHGRISKHMILISDPDRPFARAAKGTVIRKSTAALYEAEITALYRSSSANTLLSTPGARNFNIGNVDLDDIKAMVRRTISMVLPYSHFEDTTNFYFHGMDSLTTADAIGHLRSQLGYRPWLAPNLFYTNPSVNEVTSTIFSRLNGNVVLVHDDRISRIKSTIQRLTAPYERCEDSYPKANGHVSVQSSSASSRPRIAITGTTGSLGSELIASILESMDISELICLNRSTDARKKWQDSRRTGSQTDDIVKFLTVDFTEPDLKLTEEELEAIQTCNAIIHNAWTVNFNLTLSSFEDNLQGLRNIIDVCSQASVPPHLVYISSVSSVGQLTAVPEKYVGDLSASLPTGYGESKLAAESILEHYGAQTQHLSATILRVGQIAASSVPGRAPWPEKEAFPGMFKTSRTIRLIPGNLPNVRWIPIDHLASIIIELSLVRLDQESTQTKYFNIVNPNATKWQDLIEPLKQYCGNGARVVPLQEWLDALQEFDCTDMEQLRDKPALKTLEHFESIAKKSEALDTEYETAQTTANSHSFAALKPIDQNLLSLWLEGM